MGRPSAADYRHPQPQPAGHPTDAPSPAGGSGHRRAITSDGCAVEPTWSATGQYVVYWDKCAGAVTGSNAIRKVNTGTGAIGVVVGAGGLAQPDGIVHFFGTGPDVTPGGGRLVFTAADPSDLCGVAITDLSGGSFRFLSAPIDCGVFLSDDPAVSPDGTQVVYTAGNENPQLDVVRTDGVAAAGPQHLRERHQRLSAPAGLAAEPVSTVNPSGMGRSDQRSHCGRRAGG